MADLHKMELDELAELAERAARNARRAAVFTGFVVLVAALILALDHSIKRAILDAAGQARKTVDEFKLVAKQWDWAALEEARNDGSAAPGEAGASPSADHSADSGVGDDSGARAEIPGDESNGGRTKARGRTGTRSGP